ncbi:DUF3530 family protein [Sulfurimonas sp. C5]|uniref:DUF3530 family protein n=1 Tax=Sulfurimonas sp. C5 TaxID=3036947 RepID=UPI002456A051|nr:DUF3530 family protein [Sulfurimonas sp. C5]MDH4945047.1 DUF3530 family protein [Sulfurimonas sp. C5]
MKFFLTIAMLSLQLLAIDMPKHSLYLQGNNENGIILAHGKGKNPDFKVVKPLRIALNEDMGFHTLSLQMPINHKEYREFEVEQPAVNAMINQAIQFLHSKGVKNIYLIGHSLGAGMTSSFLVSYPKSGVKGYIAVGCRGNESKLISCNDNMKKINIPVFDIWGDANEEDKRYAATRTHLQNENYTQYPFPNANHVLDGVDGFLIEEVENWIEQQQE